MESASRGDWRVLVKLVLACCGGRSPFFGWRPSPFPPPRDPAGLVEKGLLLGGGDGAERKKMLRKALLRWHPDKWVHLGHKLADEEKGALGERLSTITQALVEQRDSA